MPKCGGIYVVQADITPIFKWGKVHCTTGKVVMLRIFFHALIEY